jgi:hypothetical protein
MKHTNTFILIFISSLLGTGCVSDQAKRADFFAPKQSASDAAKQKERPSKPPFTRSEAENEICGSVVRRFAEDASLELKTSLGVVFLGLTENRLDPQARLLQRFGSNRLRVLPASSASRSANDWVIEKESGKRGAILTIKSVDWLDYENVQVACSWSAEGSKELVFLYQLTRKNKKWSVT